MKYWREETDDVEYVLKDKIDNTGDDISNDRILSLFFKEDGEVCIDEACDNYFGITVSKEVAVSIFEEAIELIKSK